MNFGETRILISSKFNDLQIPITITAFNNHSTVFQLVAKVNVSEILFRSCISVMCRDS